MFPPALPAGLPSLLSATLLAALLAVPTGCALDITRLRANVPLDQEAYQKLEVGKTTLSDATDKLGAPHKVEAENGLDYLWYLHTDTTRVGLRLESPISFFGYRPTVAEFDVDAEDTSAMRLVFNERTLVLEHKSLRLAPAFAAPEVEFPAWGIYLMPRYGVSPLLIGDGGEEDYQDLFGMGQLFGGFVGILPVPYFMLLVGGNYQTFEGDSFSSGGSRVELEDLQLYQLEVGGRFQLPPEFFINFWNINKLKEIFYRGDTSLHRGFFVYFQWTLGVTYNEEVGARIDGAPAGSYFDKTFLFSNTVGGGIEYRWPHLGAFAGIDYQSIGTFDEGSAPLDSDEAGDFQSLTLNTGLSWRF